MFVTKNQIFVFIVCVSFGAIFGIIFSIFNILVPRKYKWLQAVCGCFYGVLGGFAFVWLAYVLNFPNLRLYMFLGAILGIYAYFKSFNILVAKIQEKIYNIIKLKKVKIKNDRSKIQKISRRPNRRRRNVVSDINISDGLSIDRNRGS